MLNHVIDKVLINVVTLDEVYGRNLNIFAWYGFRSEAVYIFV